jgi:hypothetical protein
VQSAWRQGIAVFAPRARFDALGMSVYGILVLAAITVLCHALALTAAGIGLGAGTGTTTTSTTKEGIYGCI